MIKPNPFTPKSGLEPRVFINREKEIVIFSNQYEIKIIKNLKSSKSNKISDINCKVKIKSINEYLRRLVEKGTLKVQKRGEYIICDRILWEYIQRKSQKSQI
jgi:predicted transcriptional regulator